LFNISGDVASKLSPGFGLHIRKAMGYVFSLRLEYMYGIGKGLNWLPSTGYRTGGVGPGENPWRTLGYTGNVFYNYKTNVQDLALEGIFTLNNIRFHKAKTGFNVYGIVGIGATVYDAKVNALNENGQPYTQFASVQGGVWKDRKETRDQLKDFMDDSYETDAENHGDRRPKLFGNTFKPVGHLGAGMAFKLSNRVNLAVEDRVTIVKDDLLDGQRWAEQGDLTRDFDLYNYFTVGLNFNLGSKATEPLYWLNPLDYAYSEIRNPRLMRLPKPVLPDADGDGVTDQFDLEQTPQGVPVDTHGVSRDTDGDGVPDSRDKELVTPTYCQPVDADGVGKCPCPEGCGPAVDSNACATNLGALPSVTFSGNSISMNNDARSLLASVAARMRQNPECRVVVIGYCASNKSQQQRSWDRVNAVINYLVEREGISGDRFIFNYGQEGGDCNTVDLRAAASGEEGPNNVPAPHPNLRR
jgi:outer membrane protein OmpA-like peptidoglycan-associated protein